MERVHTWSALLPVTLPMMLWAAPVTPLTTDWRVDGCSLEDMLIDREVYFVVVLIDDNYW